MKTPHDINWYTSVYQLDIYERLKYLESKRFSYQKSSPQLQYRYSLVRWLKKLCDALNYCRFTLHLAIVLLDFFMDSHSIKPERLTFIGIICLEIAGKFEEHDAKIPKISELNAYLKNKYHRSDVLYLERIILMYFNWELTMPTAAHFAQFFAQFAVTADDMCPRCSDYRKARNNVRNAINEYLDVTLEETELVKFPPSYVASCCIYAVRTVLIMKPIWPSTLSHATTYEEKELEHWAQHIIEMKNKQRKRKLEQSPDQGYETEKNSEDSPKSKKINETF